MDEIELILNSPITEEQWDDIIDVDFDKTNEITFYTKHGKEVKFVKSSASAPQWIKCEDCMPPDGRYLVSVHGWGEYDIQIAICRDSRWYHRHPDHIIAWKKLPRPYGNEVYEDAD